MSITYEQYVEAISAAGRAQTTSQQRYGMAHQPKTIYVGDMVKAAFDAVGIKVASVDLTAPSEVLADSGQVTCNGSSLVVDGDAPRAEFTFRGPHDTIGEPPPKPCPGCVNCAKVLADQPKPREARRVWIDRKDGIWDGRRDGDVYFRAPEGEAPTWGPWDEINAGEDGPLSEVLADQPNPRVWHKGDVIPADVTKVYGDDWIYERSGEDAWQSGLAIECGYTGHPMLARSTESLLAQYGSLSEVLADSEQVRNG